jgi:DNA-binding transcriptional ArsR family regulator
MTESQSRGNTYPLNAEALDAVFRALADPTRRQILADLAAGDSSTLTLAKPHRMSLPAVSKHLGVLERAGLIERHLVGRERRCRLVAKPLRAATTWLEFYRRFWDGQFDRLVDYMQQPEKEPD